MLGDEQVHVWHFRGAPAAWQACAGELDADEQVRASRFATEALRAQFIGAHVVLRCLLGWYLRTAPTSLRFELASRGKPRLQAAEGLEGLEFSLSHSGVDVVVAIARRIALGADVELLRPLHGLEGMARATFTPNELSHWASLPPDRRLDAFIAVWTRKESILKARGQGLHEPLDGVEVGVDPEPPARLLRPGGDDAASDWTLWSARLGRRGHVSVAATRASLEVRTFGDWDTIPTAIPSFTALSAF